MDALYQVKSIIIILKSSSVRRIWNFLNFFAQNLLFKNIIIFELNKLILVATSIYYDISKKYKLLLIFYLIIKHHWMFIIYNVYAVYYKRAKTLGISTNVEPRFAHKMCNPKKMKSCFMFQFSQRDSDQCFFGHRESFQYYC